MFYQIFLSPQGKWCAIIAYKHGLYELPLSFVEWKPSAYSSCQKEYFVNTSQKTLEQQKLNFSRCVLFHMKLELVSNILWLIISGNLFLIPTLSTPLQS